MTRNGSPPSSFLPSDPVPTSALSSSSSLMAGSGLGDGGTTTCLHNGNVYRHKERFTSASIGLKPDNANQCVQCVCQVRLALKMPRQRFFEFLYSMPIDETIGI